MFDDEYDAARPVAVGLGEVLDHTVGAGDAFMAVLGLWRKEPPDRSNDAANRLAAYIDSQPGATRLIAAELRTSLWEARR
jgi:sugar/nucleoside kinase (ribokinase family)